MQGGNSVYQQDFGPNQAALDLLWQRVHQQGDVQAREELICHYLPLARRAAAALYARRYHDEIEFGDYLQWATLGMIEALDRFDCTADAQFKTFASKRMKGAILDGVENASDKQRQIALGMSLRQERLNSIKQTTTPHGDASTTPLTPSPDTVLSYLAEVGIGLALSWLLEESGMVAVETEAADVHHIPYLQVLELKQLQEQVRQLVDTLPMQQKTVIRCHYVQEIPFETIATFLGLSKGRISQIHKEALFNLRQKFKVRRSCDVAW